MLIYNTLYISSTLSTKSTTYFQNCFSILYKKANKKAVKHCTSPLYVDF